MLTSKTVRVVYVHEPRKEDAKYPLGKNDEVAKRETAQHIFVRASVGEKGKRMSRPDLILIIECPKFALEPCDCDYPWWIQRNLLDKILDAPKIKHNCQQQIQNP